jgi:hypothetical protein
MTKAGRKKQSQPLLEKTTSGARLPAGIPQVLRTVGRTGQALLEELSQVLSMTEKPMIPQTLEKKRISKLLVITYLKGIFRKVCHRW